MPLVAELANVRAATELVRESRQDLQMELVTEDIFVVDVEQRALKVAIVIQNEWRETRVQGDLSAAELRLQQDSGGDDI